MKTKEEILGTATQSASHHFENDPEGQLINGAEALQAMQEYSDQECVSFADWILKNCFWHDGWNCMIEKYDDTYTTAELLTIYKKENE